MKKRYFLISLLLNIVFISWGIRHTIIMERIAPKNPEKFYSYWQTRVNYFKLLPKDSNEIIFLGDSQIEFFKVSEMFHNIRIKNRGISGDGTEGVLKRLDDVVANKPAKVFLEVGINDLKAEMPVSDIASNIQTIVNRINKSSPATKIYVNSVLPNHELQDSVTALNSKIKSIKGITFIDINFYLSDRNGLAPIYNSGDNLHLSGKGYCRWKEILQPYVN